MGGRSKSKGSTTTDVRGQMAGLDKYRVGNDEVAGMQQDMSNSQWGIIAPMFDAINQMGMGAMASNPMSALMGRLFGQEQPQQAPTLTEAAPQQPQQPIMNFNPQVSNLSPEQLRALTNMQRYR
jgi:hypothetical protein